MSSIPPSSVVYSGQTLRGRFVFGPRIGTGALGDLYRCESADGRHRFATRVLRPELAGDGLFVRRFVARMRALQTLRSPHVCKIVDFGVFIPTGAGLEIDTSAVPADADLLPAARGHNDDERAYVTYAWVDGETMAARLRRERVLPGHLVWQIATGIADALATAHAAGVAHKRLRPASIYLAGNETAFEPQLTDFLVVDGMSDPDGAAFLSPDAGRPGWDAMAGDCWAFGVSLAQALTGNLPRKGGPDATGRPGPPMAEQDCPNGVSPALAQLVNDLLAPRPTGRVTQIREVCDRLANCPEADPGYVAPAPQARSPSSSANVPPAAAAEAAGRTASRAGTGTLAMPPDALNAALAAKGFAPTAGTAPTAPSPSDGRRIQPPGQGSTLAMPPDALQAALANKANAAAPAPAPARGGQAHNMETLRLGADDLHKALAAKENAGAPALELQPRQPNPPATVADPVAPASGQRGVIIAVVVGACLLFVGLAVWFLKKG